MKNCPAELLYLILQYLGQHYSYLLLLRTICKEWKEIAEHSLFWLDGELLIQAPQVYRLEMGIHIGLRKTLIIGINDEIPSIPKRQFLILIKQGDLHGSNIRNPLITKNYDDAAMICAKFLEKKKNLKHSWESYLLWLPYLHFWRNVRDDYFISSPYFIPLCVFSAFFLAASVYCFSDIDNYAHELSAVEIIGFVGIYWCSGFCAISLLTQILGSVSYHLLFRYSNIPLRLDLSGKDTICIMIFNTLVPIPISIGLLQYALTHDDPNMRFVYISIPLWCFQLLNFFVIFGDFNKDDYQLFSFIFVVAMGLIVLTITLAGVYYDSSSHDGILSLGYIFIPMAFHGIGFLILAILAILDFCQLLIAFLKGDEIIDEVNPTRYQIFSRFFFNFLKNSSIILMFMLIFNLFYQGFMNSLSLSTSLMTIVLFFLLIPLGIFFLACEKDISAYF